jgi:hypothetical protein
MQSRTYKGAFGWKAETVVNLTDTIRLCIVTMKRYNGALITSVTGSKREGDYYFYTVLKDFNKSVLSSTPARVTQKPSINNKPRLPKSWTQSLTTPATFTNWWQHERNNSSKSNCNVCQRRPGHRCPGDKNQHGLRRDPVGHRRGIACWRHPHLRQRNVGASHQLRAKTGQCLTGHFHHQGGRSPGRANNSAITNNSSGTNCHPHHFERST